VSEPFTVTRKTDKYIAHITVYNFDKEKHQEKFAELCAELINKQIEEILKVR
jgi:hypothetical protein